MFLLEPFRQVTHGGCLAGALLVRQRILTTINPSPVIRGSLACPDEVPNRPATDRETAFAAVLCVVIQNERTVPGGRDAHAETWQRLVVMDLIAACRDGQVAHYFLGQPLFHVRPMSARKWTDSILP